MSGAAVDQMRQRAEALIRRHGVEGLWRRTLIEFDPVSGCATGSSEVTSPIVLVSLSSGAGVGQVFDVQISEDVWAIRSTTRCFLVAMNGVETLPAPGDEIEAMGAVWLVLGCDAVSPAGRPILCQLGVKKT